jgi:hypothetical protein
LPYFRIPILSREARQLPRSRTYTGNLICIWQCSGIVAVEMPRTGSEKTWQIDPTNLFWPRWRVCDNREKLKNHTPLNLRDFTLTALQIAWSDLRNPVFSYPRFSSHDSRNSPERQMRRGIARSATYRG